MAPLDDGSLAWPGLSGLWWVTKVEQGWFEVEL
jgi:hypothetical protein